MYWHIDADIISLLVFAAIYVYSLRAPGTDARDKLTRRFLWCLRVGAAVTLIDIFASVVMEVPVGRFTYHLMMTLDFVGLELTIVCWLRYCAAILYQGDGALEKRATRAVGAVFALYAAFVVTNPWTGAIYALDAQGVYRRGPLFFLMTALYALYVLALLAAVLRRRKRLPAGYSARVLLTTPLILAASIAAQLLNPGWLMILPGYMFSMVLAFLFLQSRRARERESAAQLRVILDNLGGGVCAFAADGEGRLVTLMANDACFAIFGYTREQFEAETDGMLSVVAPEEREAAAAVIGEVLARRGSCVREYRCRRRDGSACTVRFQNSVAAVAGMGDTVLLAALTDITDLKAAEEAARVHEAEMRLAMAQMGKMICEYTPATRTLTMPEVYAKQFGVPTVIRDVPADALRDHAIAPECLEDYRAFHEAIQRGEPTGALDFRVVWQGGSVRWEHAVFHSIFDSAGQPAKAIIAVEDTTELHRQYELEQSRPTLGEENLLVHALFDLNTGRTLDYAYRDGRETPNVGSMDALLTDERLEKIIFAPGERARYRALNDRKSLLARFEAGETELSLDYRRRLSPDEILWTRNILRMIREPGGSDILLFEYCYNIEAEKTQELMYGALVNENFDFVGRVNGRNRRYELLTGSRSNDAMPPPVGDDLDAMVRAVAAPATHPDDREALLQCVNVENILRQLARKDSYQFTSRLVPADGSVRYKALNMYYLDRERQIVIITREDVSEAVRSEMCKNDELSRALAAAEQASLAKSRFLSRMSHELRTPMNVILGTTALAALGENTLEGLQSSCRTINASARYLLSLINDILEISRIEDNRVSLIEAPFGMSALLSAVGETVMPLAREKGVHFETAVRENVAPAYVGDRAKIRQILVNLLDNAVKFTPAGGKVSLAAQEADGGMLRFCVRDNGAGIDPDFVPHLFDLFSQEASGNTSATAGTGLGLTVVKRYAEMMGGSVRVETVKGEGSAFTVEVKAARAREDRPARIAQAGELPNFAGRKMLVVEDNTLNAMILAQLLKKVGASVAVAQNGQIAVDAFSAEPFGGFDAILMDIRMPVMDGLTAAKSIRALDRADGRTVPIIAVSANAFDEDVALSLASGMNEHLAKPIEPAVLFGALDRYMK